MSRPFITQYPARIRGPASITRIKANEVGILVYNKVATTSAPYTEDVLRISDISSGDCYIPAYIAGIQYVSIDGITAKVIQGPAAIYLEKSGTHQPVRVNIGDSIYSDLDVPIVDFSTWTGDEVFYGTFPKLQNIRGAITIADSDVISNLDLQHRSRMLYLNTSDGTARTLGATSTFPLGVVMGQELVIAVQYSTGDIKIPSASDTVVTNGSDITMSKGGTYRFIAKSDGKWQLEN